MEFLFLSSVNRLKESLRKWPIFAKMNMFGNNIFTYTDREYIEEENIVVYYGLDNNGTYAVLCLEDGNLSYRDSNDNIIDEFLLSSWKTFGKGLFR